MPEQISSLEKILMKLSGKEVICNARIVLNEKNIGVLEVRPFPDWTYSGIRGVYLNNYDDLKLLLNADDSEKIKVGRKSLTVIQFKQEYFENKQIPIYLTRDILESHLAGYAAHVQAQEIKQKQMLEQQERQRKADAIRQEAIDNGWQ